MNTVFFDVDTQLDFLYPAGALYVPGAETLLPALTRLTNFAAAVLQCRALIFFLQDIKSFC